jgi:hypothetical protein
MFFKNRSFNVKLVNDGKTEYQDPMEGVFVAQQYAILADGMVKSVASTVITVIVVKGAVDLVKILAKKL